MTKESRARTIARDAVTAAVVYLFALGLERALKAHLAKTGRYPDVTTGFAALIDLEIVDKEPRDGWGNPYRYELVDGRPIITSFGSDARRGGDGDAADITSRPAAEVSSR